MNVKIKNKGRGCWVLEIESENPALDNRILVSITSFVDNQHYCITDYRYARALNPSIGDSYSDSCSIEASDILKQNFNKIFYEPVSFYENGGFELNQINGLEYYCWNTCDGVVFAGADRPYNQQKEILKNPRHVFSYKFARNYLNEAKNFWEYFNGTFEESKIENIYRLPTDFEIRRRLKLI